MRRLCLGLACFVLYVAQAGAQTTKSSPSAAPSDAEIRRILAERIDVHVTDRSRVCQRSVTGAVHVCHVFHRRLRVS